MKHLPYHPAPGLGDLVGGWMIVPQNPILDAGTVLVPSAQATAPNQIMRRPGIGELMAGGFSVPQNPLRNPSPYTQTAQGGMGCGCAGCGCSGGWNAYGMSGLGQSFSEVFSDIGAGNFSQAGTDFVSWLSASTMISSVPNWILVSAGVAAAALILPGGKEYRTKKRALASQYRGYKRAAASIS